MAAVVLTASEQLVIDFRDLVADYDRQQAADPTFYQTKLTTDIGSKLNKLPQPVTAASLRKFVLLTEGFRIFGFDYYDKIGAIRFKIGKPLNTTIST